MNYMFFVYPESNWSCTINQDNAILKLSPPNQHGYITNLNVNATITFQFNSNLTFIIQFRIISSTYESVIITTHPNEILISYSSTTFVWHPFHRYVQGNDGERHFVVREETNAPTYPFFAEFPFKTSQIIADSITHSYLTTSGALTNFPCTVSLKKQSKCIFSIPLKQGITTILYNDSDEYRLLNPLDPIFTLNFGEKLLFYFPFAKTKELMINYIVISDDVACDEIHINYQDKRAVSITNSIWSSISVSKATSKTCLIYLSDEVQRIRIDYEIYGGEKFQLIRPKKIQVYSKQDSIVFQDSIFMVVPQKLSPYSYIAYFIMNDKRMTLKGNSVIVRNIDWQTLDSFRTQNEPSEIVLDAPFATFSFKYSIKAYFLGPGAKFKLWNSTPNLPSEISAEVYTAESILYTALPHNDISFYFSEFAGYIDITVNTKQTLYHAFVLQNNTKAEPLPFKCNDFYVTSQIVSYFSMSIEGTPCNESFKRGWSTCIYYERFSDHQISITNPFTKHIKIDVYNSDMALIDTTEKVPSGSVLLHIKVLTPPHAGSIKIIDACISDCKQLQPITFSTTIDENSDGGDALSVSDFVTNISTRKKIILLVVLLFGVIIVSLVVMTAAIVACMISRRQRFPVYPKTFRDIDDDVVYPRFAIGHPVQLIQPASFQPVYPAAYYLAVS